MVNHPVLVYWLDSCGVTNKWEKINKTDKITPTKIVSCGVLIEENDEYIVLAQSKSKYFVIGRSSIPKCSIKRIIHLKDSESDQLRFSFYSN